MKYTVENGFQITIKENPLEFNNLFYKFQRLYISRLRNHIDDEEFTIEIIETYKARLKEYLNSRDGVKFRQMNEFFEDLDFSEIIEDVIKLKELKENISIIKDTIKYKDIC